MIGKIRRALAALLCAVVAWAALSPDMRALRALPDTIHISAGQTLGFGGPFAVGGRNDALEVLSTTDQTLVSARRTGSVDVSVNLLGLLRMRSLTLQVQPPRVLIPGGQAVGVAIATQGVVVVGVSDTKTTDGLRAGDVLRALDGTSVQSAEHLTQLVAGARGRPVTLSILRNNEPRVIGVTPLKDENGVYRLGAWVRDGTAGVGTLSFIDPETGAYGALGHAITDADTGLTLPVREGNILKADIVDIRKGSRGSPGELRGSFLRSQQTIGDITQNTSYGIYGTLDKQSVHPLYPDGLPVGLRDSVHTGKATILSCIMGEKVEEYDVEITQVARQSAPAQKSMVLRVTDRRLLESTGGIVQGMSGSPIVQDGHVVGAVTHVFVNDPTQGYGLFIEWMLAQAEQQAPQKAA